MATCETLAPDCGVPVRQRRDLLGEVFDASYPRLVAQVALATGDLAGAVASVQEAFARAAAGDRLARVHDPDGWLRETALRVHARRRRRVRGLVTCARRSRALPQPPGLGSHLVVLQGLRRLTGRQRPVLVLHHLVGLDIPSLAGVLGISERSARTRLRQGSAILARSLGGDGGVVSPLLALAAAVERAVPPADLAVAERRGRQLRRARLTAAGSLAVALAAVVALGLLRAVPDGHGPDHPPVPGLDLPFFPASSRRAPVEPGTYRLLLSADPQVPFVLLDVPRGWTAWYGPDREIGARGYVGLVVHEVTAVATEPCRPLWFGMEETGRDPAALVSALTRLPRHEVTSRPVPDDRFGHPATHLQVRAAAGATCANVAHFELWNTDLYGPIPLVRPSTLTDAWVVDVHGRTLLVAATRTPATPAWALRQLDDVLASVRFLPRRPPPQAAGSGLDGGA